MINIIRLTKPFSNRSNIINFFNFEFNTTNLINYLLNINKHRCIRQIAILKYQIK